MNKVDYPRNESNAATYKSVSAALRGVSLYSGDSKLVNVLGVDMLVSRDVRLDRSGNPVHRARAIEADGRLSRDNKSMSNGGLNYCVLDVLKKLNK